MIEPLLKLVRFSGIFSTIILFAVIAIASTSTQTTSALSGSDFDAGRIIDDSVFYNKDAMSINQIQNFLDSKQPNCDTNGSKSYSYYYRASPLRLNDSRDTWVTTSRATYGERVYQRDGDWRGSRAPYTCLNEYTMNTNDINPVSGLCGGYSGESNETIAQILHKIAQSCGINPQVMLVLLQKEQSLVTDDWPWELQYKKATGVSCPDSYPSSWSPYNCDPDYLGFFKQMYYSAERFKIYEINADGYNYRANRNNTILWHPDINCGTSNVFIQNQATAALYIYTPYRPNQAALDNLYGTGNGCSSYGNRNFWRMFNDWFGTTLGYNYHAMHAGQSSHPTVSPGQTITVHITFRNSGNWAWYDNTTASQNNARPVRLSTLSPVNRWSDFGNSSWGSGSNRPTGVFDIVYRMDGTAYDTNPHIVKPGESAKFAFDITVPSDKEAGNYREHFGLIVEGSSFGVMPTYITPWIDIKVQKFYAADYVTQSAYPTLRGGESKPAFITYKNTGNVNWFDNAGLSKAPKGTKPTRLATTSPINRASVFGDSSWGSGRNRPAGTFHTVYKTDGTAYDTNPHRVKPGESAKFAFNFIVPDNHTPGTLSEYFVPVNDGGYGVITTNTNVWLNVTTADSPSAKALTTNRRTTINALTSDSVTYSFRNTGSTTWSQATTFLDALDGNVSRLQDDSWLSSSRVSQLNESTVDPGDIGSFTVVYNAPQTEGTRSHTLSPSIDEVDIGLIAQKASIITPKPTHKATFHSQSAYPFMRQNSNRSVYFRFENTGDIAWHDLVSAQVNGIKPVVLASTSPINRNSNFNARFDRSNRPAVRFSAVYEDDGVTLASNQHVVKPGQIGEFTFTLNAPQNLKSGKHREWFQPILEGGSSWSLEQKVWMDIVVIEAHYSAVFTGQSSFPTIPQGSSAQSYFRFRNEGNSPWYDTVSKPPGLKHVTLATASPINRISLLNASFVTSNRPAVRFSAVYEDDGVTLASNQHVVKPGQIGEFTFTFSVPVNAEPGIYKEVFRPIVEGGSPWSMGQQLVWLYVTVP